MSDETRALVAITALNNMFESGHFSICTIDSVAKVLGVIPDAEAYETLRPLHCVDWQKMPKALRDRVPGLIQQALMGDARFKFELAPREQSRALAVIDGSPHTRRPFLKRLFAG